MVLKSGHTASGGSGSSGFLCGAAIILKLHRIVRSHHILSPEEHVNNISRFDKLQGTTKKCPIFAASRGNEETGLRREKK